MAGWPGGGQVAQVGGRLPRWWTVSKPAAVPFGRRQRHIRFAGFRPEQGPSRLRALARPYPPTISIEIAEVVHRHRRVGMRHADGPQVPLKSKVRFQWNLRLLSAEADSMNVFAPAVTASTASTGGQRQNRRSTPAPSGPAAPPGRQQPQPIQDSPPTASRARQSPSTRPRKDSTVRVCRSSTTRTREANNTRARLLDRPSRLGQPDDLPPETTPSSRVPPGQKPAATLRSTSHTPCCRSRGTAPAGRRTRAPYRPGSASRSSSWCAVTYA
ncbi:hypothetical protein A8926_4038 [Saccharopolyspora spinosa]|uniref:Uncharacterized protein n=1 Tax=Saccharopolyspora spinosa TaxID=60894 RepID=A0A2N3XZX3_SACSN|nr:hypothetical protein A8926_4038 [Saccharopolyspora spinosa]